MTGWPGLSRRTFLRGAGAAGLSLTLGGFPPAFLDPPVLPAPGSTADPSGCTPGDPGTIPPPGAVEPI